MGPNSPLVVRQRYGQTIQQTGTFSNVPHSTAAACAPNVADKGLDDHQVVVIAREHDLVDDRLLAGHALEPRFLGVIEVVVDTLLPDGVSHIARHLLVEVCVPYSHPKACVTRFNLVALVLVLSWTGYVPLDTETRQTGPINQLLRTFGYATCTLASRPGTTTSMLKKRSYSRPVCTPLCTTATDIVGRKLHNVSKKLHVFTPVLSISRYVRFLYPRFVVSTVSAFQPQEVHQNSMQFPWRLGRQPPPYPTSRIAACPLVCMPDVGGHEAMCSTGVLDCPGARRDGTVAASWESAGMMWAWLKKENEWGQVR
jgi:hypothetical protein